MLAQAEEIARPSQEFMMIDRRIEKVRRASFKRLQAEGPFLEDGDHDHRYID